MTESQTWKTKLLAGWGFHYRVIAQRVFGIKDKEVESNHLGAIGRVLRSEGIRTRDYRDGLGESAQSVFRSVSSTKKKEAV